MEEMRARVILDKQKLSIICLAETFFNKNESDSTCVCAEPGYQNLITS